MDKILGKTCAEQPTQVFAHGTGVDGLLHLLYNRLYGNLGVKINFIEYLKFLYFRGWLYHDMKTESFVENSS